jgi:hypothetical protein
VASRRRWNTSAGSRRLFSRIDHPPSGARGVTKRDPAVRGAVSAILSVTKRVTSMRGRASHLCDAMRGHR